MDVFVLKQAELANALAEAANRGVMEYMVMSGQESDVISRSRAEMIWGPKAVAGWIDSGMVKPMEYTKSGRPLYSRRQMADLKQAAYMELRRIQVEDRAYAQDAADSGAAARAPSGGRRADRMIQ